MRILNLCIHDMAGSAYALSHAINKYTEHQAINLRSSVNYVQYPAIAEMRNYDVPTCKAMVKKADVVVFNFYVKPLMQGLELTKQDLEGKTVFVYYHGSELRMMRDDVIKEAKENLDTPNFLVSTPDLLLYAPSEAKWLPVSRDFKELTARYGTSKVDAKALRSFIHQKAKITFCHAPSDEAKKGSNTFYTAITKLLKVKPEANFTMIRNQPWDACLRMLAQTDVYLDQNPPFIGSYGVVAIEASMFKIPIFTMITEKVAQIINDQTTLDPPFITWISEDDLLARLFTITEKPKIRKILGEKAYAYGKQVHDAPQVAKRFMEIIACLKK